MSTNDAKSTVRRFFEALNAYDHPTVASILAPSYRLRFDSLPEMNREAALGFFQAFLGAFSGLEHQVLRQIAEGDVVASEIVVTGTNTADFMGMPATQKAIEIGAINLITVDGDAIIE